MGKRSKGFMPYHNQLTCRRYTCHYEGCGKQTYYDKETVVHSVPKTSPRKDVWRRRMGIKEDDKRTDLKCCNHHFLPSDYNRLNKLNKSAVPLPCKSFLASIDEDNSCIDDGRVGENEKENIASFMPSTPPMKSRHFANTYAANLVQTNPSIVMSPLGMRRLSPSLASSPALMRTPKTTAIAPKISSPITSIKETPSPLTQSPVMNVVAMGPNPKSDGFLSHLSTTSIEDSSCIGNGPVGENGKENFASFMLSTPPMKSRHFDNTSTANLVQTNPSIVMSPLGMRRLSPSLASSPALMRTPKTTAIASKISSQITSIKETPSPLTQSPVMNVVAMGPKSDVFLSRLSTTISSFRRGLKNVGNTCFVNATLQALFGCTNYREKILYGHWGCPNMDEDCIQCFLLHILKNLELSLDSPYAPVDLVQYLWRWDLFVPFKQGCAMELLTFFNSRIEEQQGLRGTSTLLSNLSGKLVYERTCSMCHKTKYKHEDLHELHVDVHETLEIALACLRTEEEMSIGNYPECERCRKPTPHKSVCHILELPKIVVFQISRFEANLRDEVKKKEGPVVCPREITIKTTTEEKILCGYDAIDQDKLFKYSDGISQSFKLATSISHFGTYEKGHYVTYEYTNEGRIIYNDSCVELQQKYDVDNDNVYILIYEEVSPNVCTSANSDHILQSNYQSGLGISKLGSIEDPPEKEEEKVFAFTAQSVRKKPVGILRRIKKTKVSQLTRDEAHIYTELKKVKKECARRGRLIKNLREQTKDKEKVAVEFLQKNLPQSFVYQTLRQIKLNKLHPRGRRYTIEEKILTKTIAKGGRRAVAEVKKIAILPSEMTAQRLIRNIKLNAGFNKSIWSALEKFLSSLTNPLDFNMVLQWDEMSLKQFLSWNSKHKMFHGFEDFGQLGRTSRLCNVVLIFMVHGVEQNYKFPVSYFLADSSTPPDILAKLIIEHFARFSDIKGRIVAALSDQHYANRGAMKILGATKNKPYTTFRGMKIILLFDFPHVGKRIVAMFRRYTLQLEPHKFARIEYLHKILEFKKLLSGTEFADKLTLKHLTADNLEAMRVYLAFQVTSKTVAAALNTLIAKKLVPVDATHTSEFLDFFDDYIDSMNGASETCSKPLRSKLDDDSEHWDFWLKAEKTIPTWKFLKKDGKTQWTPSIQSLLWNINGMRHVWELCKSLGHKSILPRRFNQDRLENLIGMARDECGNNRVPTVPQFQAALKSIFLRSLQKYHVAGRNCEEDDCTMESVREFVAADLIDESKKKAVANERVEELAKRDFVLAFRESKHQFLQDQSDTYFGGVAAKLLKKQNACVDCESLIETDAMSDEHQMYTHFKENDPCTVKLTYVNLWFAQAVGEAIRIVEERAEKMAHEEGIYETSYAEVKQSVGLNRFGCSKHQSQVEETLLAYLVTTGLHWFARRKQRELKLAKKRCHKDVTQRRARLAEKKEEAKKKKEMRLDLIHRSKRILLKKHKK